MARTLFDHPAEECLQLLLLLVTEYAEHPVMGRDGIGDDGGGHRPAFIGEEDLQNAPVLGILFTLDQAPLLQRGEC